MLDTRVIRVAGALIFSGIVLGSDVPEVQWMIESMEGVWKIEEPGQAARKMTGKYEVLTSGCRIQCTKGPCKLTYSFMVADGSVKFKELPVRKLNQWISMGALADSAGTPVIRSIVDLQQIVGAGAHAGGALKEGTACSGSLRLLAPTCGEIVDVQDFRVRWSPIPQESGKIMTLLIAGADSSAQRRWNSIPVDGGEYEQKSVQDYLASLQAPDHDVDVSLRLMRSENLYATRLIRVPSQARDANFRAHIRNAAYLSGLSRNLYLLQEYLDMGMWSKAADLAQQLERDAPDSLEIRKFAMLGLCRSDFAEEIERLRNSLKRAGVKGFCDGSTTNEGSSR